jgi:hypothetical protein
MAHDLKRRELRFENLDDAVRDAAMLQTTGYQRAGKWDLSQVCGHLATAMEFPLDGFPHRPLTMRFAFWMIRNTFGGPIVRRILRSGSMGSGAPAIKETIPAPGGDETQAVQHLRSAVARLQNHTGPLHPSPIFGSLDREQLNRLQLIHCAHHLGFLLPKKESAGASKPGT